MKIQELYASAYEVGRDGLDMTWNIDPTNIQLGNCLIASGIVAAILTEHQHVPGILRPQSQNNGQFILPQVVRDHTGFAIKYMDQNGVAIDEPQDLIASFNKSFWTPKELGTSLVSLDIAVKQLPSQIELDLLTKFAGYILSTYDSSEYRAED